MKLRLLVCVLTLIIVNRYVAAEDFTVEALAEPAPSDEISESIAEGLSDEGFRVLKKDRPFCDVWLLKELPAKEGFTPTLSVLYPFEPGKLMGVIRYHKRGGDFRDQDIDKGVYTLRYAQQPVDGNHVGTSDTRDFILLSLAEDDEEADLVESDTLNERSADAAQSAHPCMLSMLRTADDASAELSMVHDEDRELWSVQVPVATTATPDKELIITFVVSGYAEE